MRKNGTGRTLVYCGINNLVTFSRLRPQYHICYGFDANPVKVEQAKKIYANDPNAMFFFGALTEKGGETVEFNITTDWDPSSTMGKLNPDYIHMKRGVLVPQETIKVPTINLYEFCLDHGIDYIDTLITDLQGMDSTVIRTLRPLIAEKRIGEIQCESEPDDTPPLHLDLPSNKLSELKKILSQNYDLVGILPEVIPEDSWEMDVQWRVKGADARAIDSEECPSHEAEGLQELERANHLFSEKKYWEACLAYGRATESGLRTREIFWNIALCAKELGKPELVRSACEMVLSIDPTFAYARQLPKHADGYYSQYDQDTYIEGFFQKVPPRTKFFVEVGAFDGTHYSNVRRLHEKYGWTGISIEPVMKNFEKLKSSYEGTTVQCIRAAVSDNEGEMEMNVSTYSDLPDWGSDIASLHDNKIEEWSQQYEMQWTKEKVPVLRLENILESCRVQDFDLLCVDTEGNDLRVLNGLDFNRFRPSLILVEYDAAEYEAFFSFFADKGYSCVEDNHVDLFFARDDLIIEQGLSRATKPGTLANTGAAKDGMVINIVYHHFDDTNPILVHKENTSVIWTSRPVTDCHIYAYVDSFGFRGKQNGPDVLLLLEPIVVLPGEYDNNVWKHFDRILSFNDFLVEKNDERFLKILYPRSDGHDLKPVTENIRERDRLYPVHNRRNALCMINGNRISHVYSELYSRRFQVADWFSRNARTVLDVYGTPGFPLKNYIGTIAPDQKFQVLAQYKFCLCFENTNHPRFSLGYVTEKMLDCLETRTIPVYLGAPNIEKYVPRGCFIDFRDFEDLEALDTYLQSMTDHEYRQYIRKIDEWVMAGNLARYSWHSVYDRLEDLTTDRKMPVRSAGKWVNGVADIHKRRDWAFSSSPVMWTWEYLHKKTSPVMEETVAQSPDDKREPEHGSKVTGIGGKAKIKLLYGGLRYNYGDSRRGFDYGTLNMYDALKRFSNVETSFFDFVTEGQQKGLAGMSEALVDRIKRDKPDILFYISYDAEHDVLRETMGHITGHTDTVTIIWMSDDHWRFDSYSKDWVPYADFVVTTSREALQKYNEAGFGSKTIKSQWAFNPYTYKSIPVPRNREASFIGMAHGDRPAMIKKLREGGLPVDVFGYGWGNNLDIPFHDMLRIFSESRININLSNASTITTQQIKGRNFEVPGCRAFLLTTPAEDLESYYDIGREIIVASSIDEILDKSKYYRTHDTEREKIAQRGYERTIAEHTWVHRFRDMFRQIGFDAKPRETVQAIASPYLSHSRLLTPNEWYIAKQPSNDENIVVRNPEDLCTIVVMAYNQIEYTRICIESILHYTSAPFELLLVDNGSSDDTFAYYRYIQSIHANTRIIKAFQNRIAENVFNRAMSISRGKYIIFVSNDTVVHQDWLENFVGHMEAFGNVGIVGPRSNSVSGTQLMAADYKSLEEFHTFASEFARTNKGARFETDRVVGMVSMMRKDVLERVGGLDPHLPTNGRDGGYGFSDNDFCMRLLAAGYRLIVADDVFIHHFGSMTVSKDRSDVFSTGQNINLAKFEKTISENPRIMKQSDGSYLFQPMALTEPVEVPDRYRIRKPVVHMVFIGRTMATMAGAPEATSSGLTIKTFSVKSLEEMLQSENIMMPGDYIVIVNKAETSHNDLVSLVENAIHYPDVAILVPAAAKKRNHDMSDPSGDLEFLPFADLTISVLNMDLVRGHLNVLCSIPDIQEKLYFLQRRVAGDGYYIARANSIKVKKPGGRAAATYPLPENLLTEGKLDEAKAIYERDIEIDPGFVRSAYNIADIENQKGNLPKSIAYLRYALAIDEHYIPAYLLLAKIYLSVGNYDQADLNLRMASSKQSRDPDVIDAMIQFTECKERTGNRALTDLDRQIDEAFLTASQKIAENDAGAAVAILEDLVQKHPDVGILRAGYGTALFGVGEYKKAEEMLQQALSLLPFEQGFMLQLAETYLKLDDREKAEEILRKADLLYPENPVIMSHLVNILIESNRTNEAIEFVRNALQRNPLNSNMIVLFGHIASVMGNKPALRACSEKLHEIDPGHPAIAEFARTIDADGLEQNANSINGITRLCVAKQLNYALDMDFLTLMQSLFTTDVFVETGTFRGNTTLNAAEVFQKVYTIELHEGLYEKAKARFQERGNIFAFKGDAAETLPRIIAEEKGKILFWLDGHYSGEGTARSDKDRDTPIIEELQAINSLGITNSVIMIDDVRLFPNGSAGDTGGAYPPLGEVCSMISTISTDYRFVIYGDILIAYNENGQSFSPVVLGCTISRLYDDDAIDEEVLFQAEDAIRAAGDEELSALCQYCSLFSSNDPSFGYFRLWLALIYMGRNDFAAAIDEITLAIKEGFYHWRLNIYLAESYLKAGSPGLARDSIQKALKEAPQSGYAQQLANIIDTMPGNEQQKKPADVLFQKDADEYTRLLGKTEKRFEIDPNNVWCVNERTPTLSFDPHYVLHTSWAARVLAEKRPEKHIDISSSVYFSTIASAFVPMEFYDYRPAPIALSGLESLGGDATQLPFADNSIASLSCMHVVEHIGLGRYGDPIDPDGDLKAIRELKRVVAPGGTLLFVVPIGNPRLVFNAHRIYSYDQIIEYFDGFDIRQFLVIPDTTDGNWALLEGTRELSDRQSYGCGCFLLTKMNGGDGHMKHEDIRSETIPGLTSIIVVSNDYDKKFKNCLESIDPDKEGPCEVLVCWQAANVPAWLTEYSGNKPYCSIQHISPGTGFSKIFNEVLDHCKGQYIMVLGDSAILMPGTISRSRARLDNNVLNGISVSMSNRAKSPQQVPATQGMTFQEFVDFSESYSIRNQYRAVTAYDIDHGCVVLRRSLIDVIGPMNEQIGSAYFALNDFRIRSLLAGYQTIISVDTLFFREEASDAPSFDTVFNRLWNAFDPSSEIGKQLSPHVAMKNAVDHNRKGHLKEAVEAITDGLQYAPNDERLYYCLAEILLQNGLYSEVVETIQSLPEHARENQRSLELLGYCSFYLQDLENAHKYTDEAFRRYDASGQNLNLRGLITADGSDVGRAEEFYRMAIARDPSYADPYINLGVIAWHRSDTAGALDLIEKGFILSPETGDFSTTYLSAINSLNEYARAERVVEESCALFPNSRKLCFLLISILLQQAKYGDAMILIEKALLNFDSDDEMLSAAIGVREKVGPITIDASLGKKTTLSVCMIVKDEEKYIKKCLASIKPVADEIIVVDTGSKDRTKDICRIFGARVYDLPWTHDFSEARNASLDKATGDFILVHDADEILSPRDHGRLKETIEKGHSGPIAYEIMTRNYILEPAVDGWTANDGKYREEEAGSGWFPSTKVRLFTNDRSIRFSNPVHEILEHSIMQAGIRMERLDIPVHHYGKLPSEGSTKKADAYYALGKQKLKKMGNVPIALRELAIQAEELGKHEEAIEHWLAYAGALPGKSLPYFNMATIYLEMDEFSKALEASQKAYDIDPDKKETILTHATMSLCAGDPREAVRNLEKLLRGMTYPPAEVALAIAYCVAGRGDKGFTAMRSMIEKGYDYDLAIQSFSRKLATAGRKTEALLVLECIVKCSGGNSEIHGIMNEIKSQL